MGEESLYLEGAAAPASGTYIIGNRSWNTAPAPSGTIGWVCTTAGTAGVLNGGATTGGITNGTPDLVVSSATDLLIGQFITIAGVTGTKEIVSIDGTDVVIDVNADAKVAGAAVAFFNPTFKTWGDIAA